MKYEATAKKNKKRLSTPKKIIVAILCLLIALILGAGIFTIGKMYKMSRNAARIVPKPTVSPYGDATPDPGLIDIGTDPGDADITKDYEDPIDPDLIFDDPIYVENAIDPDVINILILGEDKSGTNETGRSDMLMVASYNQKTNVIKVVSILRDTWIYIPGRELWNRVNTAYRFGGIGLAINTINANFGLDIQYYMKTDFDNLVRIVDTLGGIDMKLTEEEIAYYNSRIPNDPITPGEGGVCHLDGVHVLAHCRNRTLGNGDWSRTERQRETLNAFFFRIRDKYDASSLTALVYKMMDFVETNLSPWQMISIATKTFFSPNSGGIARGTIPCSGSWSYAWERNMAVIHIDIEKNKQWIHEFFYGKANW
ncbi:MAG: LCP family protein [Clostridiales bacterium]|nr:LCP family protein [Clostridiales bacterium]